MRGRGNKGALPSNHAPSVLHILEAPVFLRIQKYLETHAYSYTEAKDLQISIPVGFWHDGGAHMKSPKNSDELFYY